MANLPAVSVIIPLYNAEKYIGEALDSLLAQTFKDFEVIVVDDCSTDSSLDIVKSYEDKFGGRLKISQMINNSGNAARPRNKGLALAQGKYIYFMDADDLLTKTALEELYNAAKENDADVIHCANHYQLSNENASTDKKIIKIDFYDRIDKIMTPTLESSSLKERVEKFIQHRMYWTPWLNLIRRDILINNNLYFPSLNIADDQLFTIFLYFQVQKFIVVPNTVYIYRQLKNSNSHDTAKDGQLEKFIHRRVNDIFLGIKLLDSFTKRFNFFQQEPSYKYAIINFYVDIQINNMIGMYNKYSAIIFDALIRKEFIAIDNDPIVAAFLFDKMMTHYIDTIKLKSFAQQAQKRIAELEEQLKSK